MRDMPARKSRAKATRKRKKKKIFTGIRHQELAAVGPLFSTPSTLKQVTLEPVQNASERKLHNLSFTEINNSEVTTMCSNVNCQKYRSANWVLFDSYGTFSTSSRMSSHLQSHQKSKV